MSGIFSDSWVPLHRTVPLYAVFYLCLVQFLIFCFYVKICSSPVHFFLNILVTSLFSMVCILCSFLYFLKSFFKVSDTSLLTIFSSLGSVFLSLSSLHNSIFYFVTGLNCLSCCFFLQNFSCAYKTASIIALLRLLISLRFEVKGFCYELFGYLF